SATGVTDFATATTLLKDYSFGGSPYLAALVLAGCYFAGNDSNLFGSAAALENLSGMRHRHAIALLTLCGMVTAYFLSVCGSAQALESIASLNSVFLPMPTVILLAEWWLCKRYAVDMFGFGASSRAAVIALFAGLGVGVATSGVIPGTGFLHVG